MPVQRFNMRNPMTIQKRKRLGGILFLAAGIVFEGAAAATHLAGYYFVGAAFIAVGGLILFRANHP